jgi:hypothetical protein
MTPKKNDKFQIVNVDGDNSNLQRKNELVLVPQWRIV